MQFTKFGQTGLTVSRMILGIALITRGAVVPVVARTYPLERATEALRHLHEDRPFGKVVLAL